MPPRPASFSISNRPATIVPSYATPPMVAAVQVRLVPRMKIAAGTMLGPYEIEHAIGAGGMGVVYRADDSRLGRKVAIKVLPLSLIHISEPTRRTPISYAVFCLK